MIEISVILVSHRFNEDCQFSNCNYREHQTHFHCMRKDCNYRFCDKTRFVQVTLLGHIRGGKMKMKKLTKIQTIFGPLVVVCVWGGDQWDCHYCNEAFLTVAQSNVCQFQSLKSENNNINMRASCLHAFVMTWTNKWDPGDWKWTLGTQCMQMSLPFSSLSVLYTVPNNTACTLLQRTLFDMKYKQHDIVDMKYSCIFAAHSPSRAAWHVVRGRVRRVPRGLLPTPGLRTQRPA